ncbi:MAG: McrC family protein, partial [Sulfurospirillum sp.]|nr:McrC family protein [Sulfurospirillum sp.]
KNHNFTTSNKKSHTTKKPTTHTRVFICFLMRFLHVKMLKNDFLHVKPNRQMKEYERILLWCKTFLLENAFSPYKGSDIAFALLFDMNVLFESYVGAYLKKKGLHVSLQDRGKHLVEEPRKFALKPDIVVTCKTNSEKLIIADTKWKIIKEEKDISQSDMYQLFAYGKKYANQTLYLIYPRDGTEQPKLNYCYETGLHLKVLFFRCLEELGTIPF